MLKKEYLIESFQKSEDAGYLFEDYYSPVIEEPVSENYEEYDQEYNEEEDAQGEENV